MIVHPYVTQARLYFFMMPKLVTMVATMRKMKSRLPVAEARKSGEMSTASLAAVTMVGRDCGRQQSTVSAQSQLSSRRREWLEGGGKDVGGARIAAGEVAAAG